MREFRPKEDEWEFVPDGRGSTLPRQVGRSRPLPPPPKDTRDGRVPAPPEGPPNVLVRDGFLPRWAPIPLACVFVVAMASVALSGNHSFVAWARQVVMP